MPAKAGIQNYLKTLDSRLRGNDAEGRFKTFYETINLHASTTYNKQLTTYIERFAQLKYKIIE